MQQGNINGNGGWEIGGGESGPALWALSFPTPPPPAYRHGALRPPASSPRRPAFMYIINCMSNIITSFFCMFIDFLISLTFENFVGVTVFLAGRPAIHMNTWKMANAFCVRRVMPRYRDGCTYWSARRWWDEVTWGAPSIRGGLTTKWRWPPFQRGGEDKKGRTRNRCEGGRSRAVEWKRREFGPKRPPNSSRVRFLWAVVFARASKVAVETRGADRDLRITYRTRAYVREGVAWAAAAGGMARSLPVRRTCHVLRRQRSLKRAPHLPASGHKPVYGAGARAEVSAARIFSILPQHAVSGTHRGDHISRKWPRDWGETTSDVSHRASPRRVFWSFRSCGILEYCSVAACVGLRSYQNSHVKKKAGTCSMCSPISNFYAAQLMKI